MINKILGLFVAAFLLVGLGSVSAQTKFIYAIQSGGVTYKVYIHYGNTVTIQMYDSQSNQWKMATILETREPEEDDAGATTTYKIKTSGGSIYEVWTDTRGKILTLKNNNGEWKYSLESSQ
ncbi:MAG: hypothetical protein MUC49_14395 [Raineya sp.]|nr:hypothetical protein [Raineya sp.]